MLNKLLHSLNLFFSNPAITTLVGILLGSFLTLIYAAALEGFWSPETVLPAYESLWNVMKKILHA